MTTRLSNAGSSSESVTVQNNDAPLTSGASGSTFLYPWQRRLSNDLVMVETARPAVTATHANTGTRLSNDAPLTTS